MHELSLALEVIDIVEHETENNKISDVHEIIIEIGDLSGVEHEIFRTALDLSVRNTILDHARINIICLSGKAKCDKCEKEFEMKHILDTCPGCNNYPSEISGGREFRLVSITGE